MVRAVVRAVVRAIGAPWCGGQPALTFEEHFVQSMLPNKCWPQYYKGC
jgi:hypothetical protein